MYTYMFVVCIINAFYFHNVTFGAFFCFVERCVWLIYALVSF